MAQDGHGRRRHQFGADRRTDPLPPVAAPATGGSLILGRLALAVTFGAWLAFLLTVAAPELLSSATRSWRGGIETLLYAGIVTLLALSAVAYLIARQGYLHRTRTHTRVPRAEIDAHVAGRASSATVLIPSYQEEPEVILQTVLSAALQELGGLRVVLLVDNPPVPVDAEAARLLQFARNVPALMRWFLEAPRVRFDASLQRARAAARSGRAPTPAALGELAADYEHAASCIRDMATGYVRHDHTDDFFVDHVLLALAEDLTVTAGALRGAVIHRATLDAERCVQLHRRLVDIFTADVAVFERKQYLTLSSEPNKAMNLNSYIGLMGSSYWEQHTSVGTLLLPCAADDPDASLHVPRTDYIVTLDADSIILPEYCLRLVYAMEEPGNEKIGVIQTPYSAFPGAPTRVERLAGATTDIQHMVHQGMAEHDAAFWVGANAVLRTDAVDELRIEDTGDGRPISRFISDRTVIEDTESTLDLTARGWIVANYPERLAYSASPPDFGTLCVQRQRWANGGLLIMAKLRTHWRAKKERGDKRDVLELLLRLNYLGSITWATAGLVLLLVYPFTGRLMSVLVVALSAPYFVVMASDLKRCGYKRTDVFRIYGFNLIMLPVNASGVLRSIGQMITGQKVAFARTPKVRHRSVAPALFVISPYVIVIFSVVVLVADINAHRWAHAVFAGANVVIAVPAIIAVIGIRYSIMDVWAGFTNQLYSRATPASAARTLDPMLDWATVLYHGSVDKPRQAHHDVPTRGAGPGTEQELEAIDRLEPPPPPAPPLGPEVTAPVTTADHARAEHVA
jgi:cellulose synthase/poly-beta-1,6-N-acetylglucosamine synthase-like glycosyltransferase